MSSPVASLRTRFRSQRIENFTESVIREMTRLAMRHGATNLAQGFPDFPAPEALKLAAADAIHADINQYSITWGAKPFRDAIAAKYARHYAMRFDPEREITVCCGATEGMIAAMLALLDPGDEVVLFEPFYENYRPDSDLCGVQTRFVQLRAPDWSFDRDELRRAFTPRTKAVILNSPNNPTGKVFTREELEFVAGLCHEFDTLAITDEIYEHIVYDGATHDSIRKVHDFLTVGAAAPLQQAGVMALGMPDEYYAGLAAEYVGKRDHIVASLEGAGLKCS